MISSRADLLAVAYSYPQSGLQHSASPPSGDGNSSVASWARSVQEPYYSNHDIAILHTIVTAAQEEIDGASEPKPLPAAALFKAYDRILPENGIDPDDDHHLSAFVFRVGGERGQGTLPDKLHTILSRMGIELEFGEDNAFSVRSSDSPAPPESPPTRLSTLIPRLHDKEMPVKESDLQDTASLSRSPSPFGVGESLSGDISDVSRDGIEHALESARRLALSSAFNRWRNAASQSHRFQGRLALVNSSRTAPSTASAPLAATFLQDTPGQPDEQIVYPVVRRPTSQTPIEDKAPKHSRPDMRPLRPASLLAVMNRWSAMATNAREQYRVPNLESSKPSKLDALPLSTSQNTDPAEPSMAATAEIEISGPSGVGDDSGSKRGSKPSSIVVRVVPDVTTPQKPEARDGFRTPNPEAEKDALYERDQRLLVRAARAREIYLASKVFNHWADKTARRLEREAVAWRHMIRFRYFRGWCQAPSSRTPVVNQMRVTTAAQKLRRAVTEHQTQFKLATDAACHANRQRKLYRALGKWSCRLTASKARDNGLVRKRRIMLERWSQQTQYNTQLGDFAAVHRDKTDHAKALHKWSNKANEGFIRSTVAQQVGLGRSSFQCLQEWWDQAEADRRAQIYRQHLLVSKAIRAFDQWNLQARAQAFVWRTEYLSVNRVFDRWVRLSCQDKELRNKAQAHHKREVISKLVKCWRAIDRSRVKLDRLDNRVQLYVRSMRLLDTFATIATRNQFREKVALKRYLRQRYQQVSSARKKRKFFSVLDQWQSLTLYTRRHAALATETIRSQETNHLATAVSKWYEQAMDDQLQSMDAHLYYVRAWWNAWNETSWSYQQRGFEAWDIWTSGMRYQYQKVWSNSSIQQQGHAHTAAVVEERHDRDKQHRAFNYWRTRVDPGKNVRFEAVPESAPSRPSHPFRMSWKTASVLRSQLGRSQGIPNYQPLQLETPTRWTGQLAPMSNVLSAKPMPSVREAEERSSAPSSIIDGEVLMSPSRQQAERMQTSNLPSTTPRGPVPTHLEQPFRTQPGPSWIRSSLGESSLAPGEISRYQPRGIKRKSHTHIQTQTDTNPIPTTKFGSNNIATPLNLGSAFMREGERTMPARTRSTASYTPTYSAMRGKSIISRPSRSQTGEFLKSESSIPIPSTRAGSYLKR